MFLITIYIKNKNSRKRTINMKRNIFKKIFDFIAKSVIKEGQVSSSRISSYFILGSILTTTLLFVIIEAVNASILWSAGAPYVMPNEHIVIFGMMLAHHLTLLGINKSSETKIEKSIQDKLKAINQAKSKDIPAKAPESGKANNKFSTDNYEKDSE